MLRVVPTVPGAFIELGLDRPAFLPGTRLPGTGEALVEGATVLIQIVKDAYEDKAPEVSAAPSFHGKLAVWTPGRPGASVSRQIAPAERARLADALAALIEPGEGVVLRSHAVGVSPAELAEDIGRLRNDHKALLRAIGHPVTWIGALIASYTMMVTPRTGAAASTWRSAASSPVGWRAVIRSTAWSKRTL